MKLNRNKADRRVRKTKKLLREAFIELLLKKDIKNISVKELASLADVNRGTFYLHYQDIYDLYKQIEDDMYEKLRSIFEKHLNENRREGLQPIMSEAFEFLAKNTELCIVVLRSEDSAFLSRIIDLGKPKTRGEWLSFLGNVEPELYEYYYSFITAGCIDLIRRWIAGGMKESPIKMANLAGRMIKKIYNK
jgi:AcrR family transcriptional regulator